MKRLVIGLSVAALSSFALPQQSGVKTASGPWIEANKTAETGPIRWSISVTRDKQGAPNSVLSIMANRHKHLIAKVRGSELKPLDRESFKGWNVPSKAVTACFGWFGGGGDIYYAVKRPHLLKIYHRAVDESDQKPQSPELVTAIKL